MTKPVALRAVNGTKITKKDGTKVIRDSGKREIKPVVVPDGKPIPPPSISTDYEMMVWNRVVNSMPKVFTQADEYTLAIFVHAVVEYEQIIMMLKQPGQDMFTTGSTGQLVINPLVKEKKAAATQILTIGQRLGLSPIARNALIDNSTQKPDTGGFDIH